MIFYHGTTLDAARSIKREGLIPHRQTAYRMITPSGLNLRNLPQEQTQFVYLDKNKYIAQSFAMFRANYERANMGDRITSPGLLTYFTKNTPEQNPSAKPALITFALPATIVRKLKHDGGSQGADGLVCACVIPPKYIRSIAEVSDNV